MLAQDRVLDARAPSGKYLQPERLGDALAALAQGGFNVLAGGTDFYPARAGKWIAEDILDITRIEELRGWGSESDRLRLGAAMTWSELLAADLPEWCCALKLAAREVGGVQIQNTGTIAGNLCNASPAADGVPALLALGAKVELAARNGRRLVPLAEFIVGPRNTTRNADELVTAIHLPRQSDSARSTFVKLGARKYLVISIAMVAVSVDLDADRRIARAAVAVGACSAVAQRLPALESRLAGKPLDAAIATLVRAEDLAPLAPIDDVRASAEYRRDAVLALVARALGELAA